MFYLKLDSIGTYILNNSPPRGLGLHISLLEPMSIMSINMFKHSLYV